jgi:hypothetical protein
LREIALDKNCGVLYILSHEKDPEPATSIATCYWSEVLGRFQGFLIELNLKEPAPIWWRVFHF